MNVFISWSGKRSKQLALLLRKWLPNVLQTVQVWMSDADIDAGMRGINEISNQLKQARIGILCVTPENQTAPWLLFEAGAISNQVSDKHESAHTCLASSRTNLANHLPNFKVCPLTKTVHFAS